MADLNSIFQNLAFPVAVCCILFYLLAISLKKENLQNDTFIKQAAKAQEQHIEYLQKQIADVIKENTKAIQNLYTLLLEIKENNKNVSRN